MVSPLVGLMDLLGLPDALLVSLLDLLADSLAEMVSPLVGLMDLLASPVLLTDLSDVLSVLLTD